MRVWVFVLLLVIAINIPFGYWRANVRKFSVAWFFAVHLPVPFIVMLRIYFHFGWHWTTYVFFIAAYFGGQFLGSRIYERMRMSGPVSSSIVSDLKRRTWIIRIGR